MNHCESVYVKLTEGRTYLDTNAYENYKVAKNAGLRFGFYHYSHITDESKKEVDFFLNQLEKRKTRAQVSPIDLSIRYL
ncbi:GH25 family lysozyme [Priestia megaterium]|uniref:GH25 family lysozyme n=1 Tax=Priestia megaterium TaxID=1404 RepID=UPI000BF26955|nr:hypothetical protein CN492_22145 [Priestia megaterium]